MHQKLNIFIKLLNNIYQICENTLNEKCSNNMQSLSEDFLNHKRNKSNKQKILLKIIYKKKKNQFV